MHKKYYAIILILSNVVSISYGMEGRSYLEMLKKIPLGVRLIYDRQARQSSDEIPDHFRKVRCYGNIVSVEEVKPTSKKQINKFNEATTFPEIPSAKL